MYRLLDYLLVSWIYLFVAGGWLLAKWQDAIDKSEQIRRAASNSPDYRPDPVGPGLLKIFRLLYNLYITMAPLLIIWMLITGWHGPWEDAKR